MMEVTVRSLNDTQSKVECGDVEPSQEIEEPEIVCRDSSLTVLLNTSIHFRTFYYITVVILLFCFLDTFLYDLLENGRLNIGFELIITSFDKNSTVRWLGLWLFELSAALSFYPALRIYAFIQKSCPGGHWATSTIGLAGLIVLQVSIILVPSWDMARNRQGWAPSGILAFEMIRLAMKIHATAVVCAPRCHGDKTPLPSFKHYVYFLFAPTLLFEDRYARNKKIRWGMVLFYILEVLAMMFINFFVWERFISPHWSDYGKQSTVEISTLIHGIFACALPGVIILSCGFYLLLHAWFNLFSEILKFGDRLFYEDWWTSRCFLRFFRSWNRVVYLWLRAHIHKPLTPYTGRLISAIIVLFVSAAAHEVILVFTFKFFYPVLLLQFGVIVVVLIPLKSIIGHRFPNIINLVLWIGIFIGNGFLWSLLPMEHFARVNCPPSENDSIFIPKSWSCPKIVFKSDWTFHNPFQGFFI